MLVGNSVRLANSNPMRPLAGSVFSGSRVQHGAARNWYAGEATTGATGRLGSRPRGYYPPYTWILAPAAGDLSSYGQLVGTGTIPATSLVGGRNAEAALTGSGLVTNAQGALIVSAVAALTGAGQISSASLNAIVQAAAALSGSGAISHAELLAVGHAVAALAGSGVVAATIRATGKLEADITPVTELSPASLAAAVWRAADEIEPGLNPREALRLISAALAGKLSGAASTTITIRSAVADGKNRIVATVDADGNRSSIVYDLDD